MARSRLTLLALLFMAWQAAASGRTWPERSYHDNIRELDDSIAVLTAPPHPCVYQAVEMRGSGKGWYGVTWQPEGSDTVYFALARNIDPDPYDAIMDQRHVDVRTGMIAGGREVTFSTVTVTDDIDRRGSEFSIAVEIYPRKRLAEVHGGFRTPDMLTTVSIPEASRYSPGIRACGKPAKVLAAITDYLPDMAGMLDRGLTAEDIDSLIAAAPSGGIVGKWEYLDMDYDDVQAHPGGYYTFAVVPAPDGDCFDIIYISGARVGADQWHEGMLKGRLIPTIFQDHYDLEWYDASMNLHTVDCNASMEQGVILNMSFPALRTSIRFSRLRPGR